MIPAGQIVGHLSDQRFEQIHQNYSPFHASFSLPAEAAAKAHTIYPAECQITSATAAAAETTRRV